MKLTLGSDAEQIIQDQLRNKKFASAEAVVLAGLKSLSAAGSNEFDAGEMKALLNEGEDSIKREGTLDARRSVGCSACESTASQERGGMKLRISRLADRDIERIWQFIARDSPTAATQVEDDIHTAMKLLAEQPGMGHQRADVTDDRYRFWAVYSYLIAYRLEGDTLIVIRVVHGARDVRKVLGRQARK